MGKINFNFTEADKAVIEKAVSEAEKLTSGEIVPYFVEKSDEYEDAIWRSVYSLSILAFIIHIMVSYSGYLRGLSSALEAGVSVMIFALVGYFSAQFIPVVRRYFAGRNLLRRRVRQRALEAFISEEVFQTRDRTGILIFISSFERMVEVIGDTGINEKVEEKEWVEVVHKIVTGMKNNQPVEGIADAIQFCGKLLERAGVEIRQDDQDELSNQMRID